MYTLFSVSFGGFFFLYICNMFIDYQSISEEARVWVYPSNRKFYKEELASVSDKVKHFVSNWKNDDENFRCSYQFLYDRFVVFLAEGSQLKQADIDKQVSFILELQQEFDVELLDRMNVCFKQGEFVQYKDVKEFKKLLKNKSVSAKTIVFDNLVETKAEFEEYWEVPITESWYNRFL